VKKSAEEARQREGVDVQRVVLPELPGQARREVHVAAPALVAAVAAELLQELVVGPEQALLALALVPEREAHEVERERPAQGSGLVGNLARRENGRLIVLHRHAGAELLLLLRQRALQHHVDGAGDRLRAELRGGPADDLDPIDHVRGDVVEREAGRHALAVHQDLRVSRAQAPHPDRAAAAAGTAIHRDAGQALQHVHHVGVAVLVDLLAVDDDLRGGRGAALGVRIALDLDLFQLLGFFLRRLWRPLRLRRAQRRRCVGIGAARAAGARGLRNPGIALLADGEEGKHAGDEGGKDSGHGSAHVLLAIRARVASAPPFHACAEQAT
jgi:hypothetical protein